MAEVDEPSPLYTCPHCQAQVQIDSPTDPFVRCPDCGQEFALPPEATAAHHPIQYVHDEDQDELNAQRIHRIVAQRRADIRLRSYFLLAAFGCIAIAITSAYRIGQRLFSHSPWNEMATLQIAVALGALSAAILLLLRAHRLTRGLNKPLLSDPTTPPDFSQLSDGSQHAQALEKL